MTSNTRIRKPLADDSRIKNLMVAKKLLSLSKQLVRSANGQKDPPDVRLEKARTRDPLHGDLYDFQVIRDLAEDPAIKDYPEVIKKLADSKDRYVIKFLARNPAIKDYPEVIEKLAYRGNSEVLMDLAANPALKDRRNEFMGLIPNLVK